jgi:hypothetical protein
MNFLMTIVMTALLAVTVTTSFAYAEENFETLNSLSELEGRLIHKALEENRNNLSQVKNKDLYFRAFPEYIYEGVKCRDVSLYKGDSFADMSVCKIGGDWIFRYN